MKIREKLEKEIASYQKTLQFVMDRAEEFTQLEEAGIIPVLCGCGIDFDSPTREQVLKIIEVLHCGKWKKSPSYGGSSIDYTNQQDGFKVRLYAASPPESCQLIEEEYEVPPQPAKMAKRFKLVCPKGEQI